MSDKDLYKKYKRAYSDQRQASRKRKIPFLLTFEEWLQIWIDSEHLEQRGRHKDQYCMARFGDRGPYVVWNVKIILHGENVREAGFGNTYNLGLKHTEETKLKMSNSRMGNTYNLGKKHTEEHNKKIGKAQLGRTRSEETKQKMRETRRNNPLSQEARNKISKAHKGRIVSDETRRKLSLAAKKRKSTTMLAIV